ncbi:hypothetical protein [Nonomuraea sp. NPDC049695]|uniref:hypothetical protein n=1 Tax=Nonomuraea sp. NPDC049695 TaxID=3154734 RepID=UPI00341C4753
MKIILSYGLGADSTAILLRWLTEPETRGFALDDLIVITAQTGDEHVDTAILVEQHIYPLLAEHRIRTVQVARGGRYERDGIVVLDDTCEPILCLTSGGPYTLADEMEQNATVPQSGNRAHSIKFKGWVIDQWIAANLGTDEPFVHVMGYEADELDRIQGDSDKGLPNRLPTYPLLDWSWDRDACEAFILSVLGVHWSKSCCVRCPFGYAKDSRDRTVLRLQRNPHQAVGALVMEYLSVAVNPRQGLLAGKQLYHLLASTPGSADLLALLEDRLDELPWAIYEVRRAFSAKRGDAMARGTTRRSLRRLVTGTRAEMVAEIARAAHLAGRRLDSDGRHHRVWVRERNPMFPCVEQALVAAPALAHDKTHPTFDKAWQAGLVGPRQLALAL